MSPPRGLAILLGAGPTSGSGIARTLAHSGLAVALLSRSITSSTPFFTALKSSCPTDSVLIPFQSDTSEKSLKSAFQQIQEHDQLKGLKLNLAIWHIKHAHKTPFLEESREQFSSSLETYLGGAMSFSQECVKWMLEQYPDSDPSSLQKKGTIIFTGTLGALRTNIGYGAYGAGRSGVRMLAQSLAREFSSQGIHVVHTIANGGIGDSNEDKEKIAKGQKMSAETVGKTYLWIMEQSVDLWVHELDMRPAAEKF